MDHSLLPRRNFITGKCPIFNEKQKQTTKLKQKQNKTKHTQKNKTKQNKIKTKHAKETNQKHQNTTITT